jgi:hypothetical protein
MRMSDLGLGTPPGLGQGVTWSPPLTGDLGENVRPRTYHPSWFRTGGDVEPALNRGFTGECPTLDLAPLLV